MKLTLKKFAPFLITLLALAGFSLAFIAYANPFQFGSSAQTAAATSSPVYLINGVSTTTTPLYDTFEVNGTNQTNRGNTYVTNEATVLVQFNGSSTSAVLKIAPEYSQDGTDWYENNVGVLATSTNTTNLNQPVAFTITAASSTIGGVGQFSLSGAATTTKAFTIKTPLRYVRLVISVSGARGAVWAQIVPLKEIKQ